MAYNHTFIIVRPSHDDFSKCGKFWARIIAVFKLDCSKVLYNASIQYPETKYFIYGENEKEIVEDPYGDPLTEVSLVDLIRDLENANECCQDSYRAALIAALNVYKDDPRNLLALHYGE